MIDGTHGDWKTDDVIFQKKRDDRNYIMVSSRTRETVYCMHTRGGTDQCGFDILDGVRAKRLVEELISQSTETESATTDISPIFLPLSLSIRQLTNESVTITEKTTI